MDAPNSEKGFEMPPFRCTRSNFAFPTLPRISQLDTAPNKFFTNETQQVHVASQAFCASSSPPNSVPFFPQELNRQKRTRGGNVGDSENFKKLKKDEDLGDFSSDCESVTDKEFLICTGNGLCNLCKNGAPYYLDASMNPGWRETILALFEFFTKRMTKADWNRTNRNELDEIDEEDDTDGHRWLYFPDAYDYLENHWHILCPPQHKDRSLGAAWKKTMQDTLSHNKSFFVNGKKIFGRNGFWRLAERSRYVPLPPSKNITTFANKEASIQTSMQTEQSTPSVSVLSKVTRTLSNSFPMGSLHLLIAALEQVEHEDS